MIDGLLLGLSSRQFVHWVSVWGERRHPGGVAATREETSTGNSCRATVSSLNGKILLQYYCNWRYLNSFNTARWYIASHGVIRLVGRLGHKEERANWWFIRGEGTLRASNEHRCTLYTVHCTLYIPTSCIFTFSLLCTLSESLSLNCRLVWSFARRCLNWQLSTLWVHLLFAYESERYNLQNKTHTE